MNEINDKEMEDLLKRLPKIKDHRDPQEIYQNISLKMSKQKRRSWFLPSLATSAALLLLVIFVPSLMNWQDLSGDSLDKATDSAKNQEMAEINRTESGGTEKDYLGNSHEGNNKRSYEAEISIYDEGVYTAVYTADISKSSLITVPIPDRSGQIIVPITLVVPADQTKTKLEQFEELMPRLKEEEWGLYDYYPLNVKFSVSDDRKTLNIDIPANHMYGEGSASEEIFKRVINNVAVMQGVETITFSTDGKPGVMFAHTGYMVNMPIRKQRNHGYYFYYTAKGDKKPYLVPSEKPFGSIKDALTAMKKNVEEADLYSSIPDGFVIAEIIESEKSLIIRLDDSAELVKDDSLIYTIEAILLTAKEFNFERVRIENADIRAIGKFLFNEEMAVPAAPNKRTLRE